MVRILLVVFLCASLSVSCLVAQNIDCEQTLNAASVEFDAGRFYGLPTLLKQCLDNGFSKEQKVRAYLLLTQAYLVLDDPIAAENSYLQLLNADPEYVANPVRDPVDVYYLSKKFTSTPIFTPTFRIGVNSSFVHSIYNLNTNSSPLSNSKTLIIGYQVGTGLEWNINDRWSIGLGVGYARKIFKSTGKDNSSQLIFAEKQDWIDVPLYVKYSVDSGKIRPFAYAGLAANFLLGSKLSFDQVDFNSPGPGTQRVSQGPDERINFKRNLFNRSLVLGGGAKYKIGKNFVYVDVRYMAGLTNLAQNPYTTSNGQFDPLVSKYYGYASDFFRLDNLSISVGYVKPLYNPRKKKKAVTGLLQKLGFRKRVK